MINFFKKLFAAKPVKEQKKSGSGHRIVLNNIGFDNIQVGDRFEGCACGNFFDNQICEEIREDGYIIGTDKCVIFQRKYIRPIRPDNETPYYESWGFDRETMGRITSLTGIPSRKQL